MLKAIETIYKGYRFRSRLEARWAVFFDALEIEYQYEPEGFNLDNSGYYLPDFFLPGFNLWVEIKGQAPTESEIVKCRELADQGATNVYLVAGSVQAPDLFVFKGYDKYTEEIKHYFKGILFIGNLEDYYKITSCDIALHPGIFESLCNSHLKSYYETNPEYFSEPIPEFKVDTSTFKKLIQLDREYFKGKYDREHPLWKYGLAVTNATWGSKKMSKEFTSGDEIILSDFISNSHVYTSHMPDRILSAYSIAKQARFEHGETPVVRH